MTGYAAPVVGRLRAGAGAHCRVRQRGTLWAEQPIYFQLVFMFDRVKALAPEHPEWKTREPFASLLKGDMEAVLGGGEKGLMEMMAATHSGMTTEEFSRSVSD